MLQFLIIPLLFVASVTPAVITDEEIKAAEFMDKLDISLEQVIYDQVVASWNYNTDINDVNRDKMLQEISRGNAISKKNWLEIKKNFPNFKNYKDPVLARKIEAFSVLGTAALDEQESEKFTNISTEMETMYSSAKVCLSHGRTTPKCGLELDPDLSDLMSKSRNVEELEEAWVAWRDASGKKMRSRYLEYIRLGNKAAVANGFKTLDDLWLYPWETENFKETIAKLWDEISPYYQKVHAFIRIKLRQHYGNDTMPADGTIPAHLLGNMWAQSWENILPLVTPYPGLKSLDVTGAMLEQGYDADKMFHLSDKFFTDLGLIPMPAPFWEKSMFTKPPNRTVVCHASAWDFYNRKDFRIKMCTQVNLEDLITVHHEMGHIQYYLQYVNQPIVFRNGANPGFHEAIGDLLALSVSTPKHLKKVGLLANNTEESRRQMLNYQMQQALSKVAFLPFGYLMDAYRWDMFSGAANLTNLNRRWWYYRIKYQGISPPVKRSEEDFDAGGKYHIPASVEYIRYFVSFIIQFQFHKSLCDIADPDVPLYECDIDGNKEAGAKLAEMLKLGSSKPWPDAMEIMTSTRQMSAMAFVEYFEPLFKYIDEQLDGSPVGWPNATVDDYMV